MMDISPPVEPHTLDAERRQLAGMFCDLVVSTALSGRLDYDLLVPVYGWFTKGFDTADLRVAESLSDERTEVES
jgi:hypothetical protein